MKKLVIVAVLLISSLVSAQEKNEVAQDSSSVEVSNWEKVNKVALDFNQVSFVNWNAGGVNSVSGLLSLDFERNYIKERSKWNNEFTFRYGSNWQEGIGFRKTDDLTQLTSSYGYKVKDNSNWFYSAKFAFTTQATGGYDYKSTPLTVISDLLAPAYIVFGIGADYTLKEKKFSAYLSPVSMKTTLVLNQTLANKGAFGVDPAVYSGASIVTPGKNSRTELGAFANFKWKKELAKNIHMENKLGLFSDYLNNFGNVDVDWQLKLDFTVNKFVRANIFTHVIYDDDIKATEEVAGKSVTVGPKVQIKQMLGVGFVYEF